MTDGEQSRRVSPVGHGERWPTAVASLIVGLAFFSLWFWLLPQWLWFRVEMAGAARCRWLAAPSRTLSLTWPLSRITYDLAISRHLPTDTSLHDNFEQPTIQAFELRCDRSAFP